MSLPEVFDRHYLDLCTNRIHDMPEVVVSNNRVPTVNVLIPAFDFNSISAGFFGVFQVARFIASIGVNVRLVLFDNFFFDENLFRAKLLGYPGMEALFDELETAYIGERLKPLEVSPYDNCVATVWYSAYFADKIMSKIGNRPFLYLIQDYETNFFPGGSLFQFADATYSFNYNALFSTRTLRDFFLTSKIGRFKGDWPKFTYFNNACASSLPDLETFRTKASNETKKVVFYSRPIVSRNMFELGALALTEAYKQGIFNGGKWEFIGIGLGSAKIQLSDTVAMTQMQRMNLKEYQEVISTFDIGLTLMASPHPSLLPFDLGGSGSVVVTNTFATKQQSYFDGICGNVIATAPSLSGVVEGLAQAVQRSSDLDARHKAATQMLYPRDWSETFDAEHRNFMRSVFSETIDA